MSVQILSFLKALYVKAEKNAIIEELALESDSKKKASSELWSSKLTFVVCRLSESYLDSSISFLSIIFEEDITEKVRCAQSRPQLDLFFTYIVFAHMSV